MPFVTNSGAPKPNWTKRPKQADRPPQKCADPGSTDNSKRRRRRKKKKHHCAKKPELKVTTQCVGNDVPIWSHTGSATSSRYEDSGLGSYEKWQGEAGSTTRSDHTPQYSLATIPRLHQGRLEDDPPVTMMEIAMETRRWPVPTSPRGLRRPQGLSWSESHHYLHQGYGHQAQSDASGPARD